jgi:hypothetical protein
MKYHLPFLSLTIVVRDLVLLTSTSSHLIVYCNSLSIDDTDDQSSSLKAKLGYDFDGVGGGIRGSISSRDDDEDDEDDEYGDVDSYSLEIDDITASSNSDFWTKSCYEKETNEGHVLKVYVMAGQSNMVSLE